MQEKLKITGHSIINNIVDATNYVMEELGQPMHAFDAKKVQLPIQIREAKENEPITTLDKENRELKKGMLVIADKNEPIAIAGVMGGQNSQIDENTTEIILESANFDPISIRQTSTTLNLRTDAVQRFEKSLDPNLPSTAIDRLCEIILQICPTAKITSTKTDIKNFTNKPLKIELNTEIARQKIGIEIKNTEITKILESLEFKVEKTNKENIYTVTVPTFRATKDIEIQDDLIEEIARIYGYTNIQAILPTLPTKLPTENTERKLKHIARNILSNGLKYTESYNYSFYSKQDIEKTNLLEELHLKVENYLSENQTHMRITWRLHCSKKNKRRTILQSKK